MGSRLEKLRSINAIADELQLSAVDRGKLLLSSYLERLHARFPFIPTPDFCVRFQFQQQPVSFFLRSNDLDLQLLDAIFIRQEYRTDARPKRILDLGGNIGTTDIYFHNCFPEAEIVSLEPLPDNLRIMRRNWEANGIPGRIIAAAASNAPGTATFYIGEGDNSSLLARQNMTGDHIEVRCTTITEVMETAGWTEIDLLKIDIEGAEVAVFQDSSQWAHKVKVIVGELHNGYTVEEMDRDLQHQFHCKQIFEYPPPGAMKGVLAVRKASA